MFVRSIGSRASEEFETFDSHNNNNMDSRERNKSEQLPLAGCYYRYHKCVCIGRRENGSNVDKRKKRKPIAANENCGFEYSLVSFSVDAPRGDDRS